MLANLRWISIEHISLLFNACQCFKNKSCVGNEEQTEKPVSPRRGIWCGHQELF